jgi:perosamine synthetase
MMPRDVDETRVIKPSAVISIPYGRPTIDEEGLKAVESVLTSGWWTTGPWGPRFEEAMTRQCAARHAIAVSSGTAALHCIYHAAGIGPGDEVIVPAMTFAATANAVVMVGGVPVFADVEPNTLLVDMEDIEKKISHRTKALVAVDYAGQPCDYDALREIANRHHLLLIADACHSLGGHYRGKSVGSLADGTIFSFHAVKAIASGEGGMVVTDREQWANSVKRFRNHGILADHKERSLNGTWEYEMPEIGYNYRITDIQCALLLSQLARLKESIERRRIIAGYYDRVFSDLRDRISPLATKPHIDHAHHLYVIRIKAGNGISRKKVFETLRNQEIGANVHYPPVHLFGYYRDKFGCKPGDCPRVEAAYQEIITLPLHPAMTDSEVERVVTAVRKAVLGYK